METLAYGTHLVVDGHGATADTLSAEAYVAGVAGEVLAALGLSSAHLVTLEHRATDGISDGVSVGIVLPESHLTLHTFVRLRSVSLGVFSRQTLALGGVSELLTTRFKTGRLESHLSSRSVALTQDAERALPFLIGERNYTEVRLDDTLLVFGR